MGGETGSPGSYAAAVPLFFLLCLLSVYSQLSCGWGRKPDTHNLQQEWFNVAYGFGEFIPWSAAPRQEHHGRKAL